MSCVTLATIYDPQLTVSRLQVTGNKQQTAVKQTNNKQ